MSALWYYFGHNSREVNHFLLAKLYLLYKFAHVKKLKINYLKWNLYRDVWNMLQTEATTKFLGDQTKLNDILEPWLRADEHTWINKITSQIMTKIVTSVVLFPSSKFSLCYASPPSVNSVNSLNPIIICNKLWLFVRLWLESQSSAVELWWDLHWVHFLYSVLFHQLPPLHWNLNDVSKHHRRLDHQNSF